MKENGEEKRHSDKREYRRETKMVMEKTIKVDDKIWIK